MSAAPSRAPTHDATALVRRSAHSGAVMQVGDRAPGGRHLLLISYYYPPINVIGALRWQKLSPVLAARGWNISVVMVDPATVDTIDTGRLGDVPAGTRMYGVPDPPSKLFEAQRAAWRMIRPLMGRRPQPARLDEQPGSQPVAVERAPVVPERASLGRRYLAHMLFWDAQRWCRRATRAALSVAASEPPDLVVSSGPPHFAHEVARRVAERRGVPFVMDMRDPWCTAENMPRECASKTWMRLAAAHEGRCVRAAERIVVTTDAARALLTRRYPDIASRFLTVMNGSDPELVPAVKRDERFTIAYTGNLYFGRDPRNLFRAAAKVVNELALTPDVFGIAFLGGGDLDGVPIETMAEQAGIARFVSHRATAPRAEALEFQARAAMLVNLPQWADLAIPAKLFEYVQYDAWLLVLAEHESATERLFRGTSADVVDPGDVDGIAAAIKQRFEAFRNGDRPTALNRDGAFNRERQSAVLADALEAYG